MSEVLAIVNCRVSTAEQMVSNSLKRQAQSVETAAKKLFAKIPNDGRWSGSVSSKAGTNVTRKDLLEMLEYCRSHKNVKYAIFDEYDRYMRSVNEGPYFEVLFEQLGVKVWYASETDAFNGDDAMAKLMRTMSAFRAEGSNEERIKKSVYGHTQAIKEGRYTFPPKPGYMKGDKPGVHVRHPNTFEPLQAAFKEVISGLYSPTEALQRLQTTKLGKHYARWDMDKFSMFAVDPYYAGILEINRQVKARNENGLHEKMVTKEEHEKLKEIFLGRKRPRKPSGYWNPEFPMNKLLACECGGKFTGSRSSNGHFREDGKPRKTRNFYFRYRCRGCGKMYNHTEVHELISKRLEKLEYTGSQQDEFTEALETVWQQKQSDRLKEVELLQKQREMLENDKSKLIRELARADESLKPDIRVELSRIKGQIQDIVDENNTASKIEEDLVEFIKFGLNYAEELREDWWDLDFEGKQRCQQLIFPGGIQINRDKKISIHDLSSIYSLRTNKKDLSNVEKSLMVELAGIAPASDGLRG